MSSETGTALPSFARHVLLIDYQHEAMQLGNGRLCGAPPGPCIYTKYHDDPSTHRNSHTGELYRGFEASGPLLASNKFHERSQWHVSRCEWNMALVLPMSVDV